MKTRCSVLLVGLFATVVASAQDSSDVMRRNMFAAADRIARSVAGAPGRLETMLQFDKSAELLFQLDDEQRQNWQFWPTARVGLPLELMSAEQRRATHDLLSSVLSSRGYLKAVHIMQLEQILDMLDEAGLPRAVDHYRLVLFGTPSLEAPWAWRFEGHHVSLSVTVAPQGVRVTPSFLGSNPAQVVGGPLAGFRVHGILEDLARDLVNSLSGPQRATAVVSERAPGEIFTANMRKERDQWEAWRQTLNPEGVDVSALNEMQQRWVGLILDEVIGNYRPAIAHAYRAGIDLDSLKFAWMGSTERGEPHYFRLQGPDFMFEYDNVQNGGNHVHSVWRSKTMDFGEDVLGDHYRASHAL